MGLPPKSYFHLTELAETWGAPMPDLACYTLDGLLQIAVMTVGVCVDTGVFASTDRGLVRIPQCEEVLHGPQPVVSSDLWPVFRTGSGRITRFKPPTPDGYVDLAQGVDPLMITPQDLLVTRSERERFEIAHGLAEKLSADTAADATPTPVFLHRENYAEVVLNGEIFRLGPAASICGAGAACRDANRKPVAVRQGTADGFESPQASDGGRIQSEAELAHADRIGWPRLLPSEPARSARCTTRASRLSAACATVRAQAPNTILHPSHAAPHLNPH